MQFNGKRESYAKIENTMTMQKLRDPMTKWQTITEKSCRRQHQFMLNATTLSQLLGETNTLIKRLESLHKAAGIATGFTENKYYLLQAKQSEKNEQLENQNSSKIDWKVSRPPGNNGGNKLG